MFGFIVAVNIVMNILIEFIGTDTITGFLENSSIFQPFIAGLIGLIPNCASSVILTQLYLENIISMGSMIAGLLVNSGIGILVLFMVNNMIFNTHSHINDKLDQIPEILKKCKEDNVNKIAVVGYAGRNGINILKKRKSSVACADINKIF